MVAFESTPINGGQAICKLFLDFWKEKHLSRALHACVLSKIRKFFIGNKKVPASLSSYNILSNCFLLSHQVGFTAFSIIHIFQNRHIITLK